jgi:hypothetical protein
MFSRREWIVIGVLLLVVVAVYGGLLFLVSGGSGINPPQAGPSEPTPWYKVLTAREAYPQAEKVAKEWRDDARLSSATAAWSRPTVAELTTGQTAWGFSFVSPSAGETAIVTVVGQQAERVQVQRVSKVPELLDVAGWQVDSPLAIRTFLDHGGEGFLRDHPDSEIHLRLSTRAEDGTIFWLAVGLSADGQSSAFLQIDAITGLVLGP